MPCPRDCHIEADEHYCWGRSIPGHQCFGGISHAHKPKKGMGGNNPNSKVVAILCIGLHDQLDNNAGRPYTDFVIDVLGERRYVIMDLHGVTVLERTIGGDNGNTTGNYGSDLHDDSGALNDGVDRTGGGGSAGGDVWNGGDGNVHLGVDNDNLIDGASAAVDTTPQEVDRKASAEAQLGTGEDRSSVTLGGNQPSPVPTFDHWEQQGHAIRERRTKTPWDEGDWLLFGEDRFGEDAPQGWDALGYGDKGYAQISQRIRVAKAFPPPSRVSGVSWSHHRRVLPLDEEDRRYWLLRALKENWSDVEMRDALIEEGLLERNTSTAYLTCPKCQHRAEVKEFVRDRE